MPHELVCGKLHGMDRLSLQAEERKVLGKKVKKLRRDGKLPGHVFGKGVEGENVLVSAKEFLKTFKEAGATGLIDLKIGKEKIRPVLIREVQYNPVNDQLIHIDFYQVNLSQKVKVAVPLILIGEQPATVISGEAIVLQTVKEIEVEALPTDLVEKIEVDITLLKQIDDAITVGQLQFDRSKLTIQVPGEEIVVKLAPAVTAEMEKQMAEQAAEAAAAAAETAPAEGGEVPSEGEAAVVAEGEPGKATEAGAEAKEEKARAEAEPKKAEEKK